MGAASSLWTWPIQRHSTFVAALRDLAEDATMLGASAGAGYHEPLKSITHNIN